MSSEWPTVRLGDLASKITKGTTPKSFISGAGPDRINFIKVETISQDGRLIPSKFAYIDAATNAILSRSVVQEDDLLFTIAGTIGRVARVRQHHLPANTNQAVAIVRANKSLVDIGYLSCVLGDRVRVQQAQSRVVQSVQANFSLAELADLEIPLPPLNEQRRIAGVLGALDDLIEVNRGLMADLDEMAAAQASRWIQSSDLKVRLSEVADHLAGKYLAKDKYEAGGQYVVHGSNSIMGTHSEFLHRGPLTVLARIGSFCGALAFSEDSAWINNNASAIRAKRPSDAYWLHRSLLSVDMDMHRAGSGQPFVRIESLMNTEIPWLSPEELDSANRALGTLEKAIAALHAENSQLASTRDELLPLLMSGRVRVVEEVAA
ncbi:MAG: restriction endonuclease subunit S [Candidatus Nanopelagicales bacterium]|nr:restriction endonuclease subunit S [Candidatus Nanopelagicales bacterium]